MIIYILIYWLLISFHYLFNFSIVVTFFFFWQLVKKIVNLILDLNITNFYNCAIHFNFFYSFFWFHKYRLNRKRNILIGPWNFFIFLSDCILQFCLTTWFCLFCFLLAKYSDLRTVRRHLAELVFVMGVPIYHQKRLRRGLWWHLCPRRKGLIWIVLVNYGHIVVDVNIYIVVGYERVNRYELSSLHLLGSDALPFSKWSSNERSVLLGNSRMRFLLLNWMEGHARETVVSHCLNLR